MRGWHGIIDATQSRESIVPISIVAKVKVNDGQQSAFEEAALRLVAAVNDGEPGCLLYTLNKGDDPSTYVFLERYADEAALAAHRESAHFKTIGKEMGALMDGRVELMVLNELL